MRDLISRDDVLSVLCFSNETGKMLCEDLRNILEEINKIPSAEPERKKGMWQRRKGSDCWECSQCHAVLEYDDFGMHNFYFCYHCGANVMNKSGYMDIEEVNYEGATD